MIIQHRRGKTADWERADLLAQTRPAVILRDGEFAIERRPDGSCYVKIGNGSSNFSELPYIDARAAAEAAASINDLASRCLQVGDSDEKLYIGNPGVNPVIFNCGTALDTIDNT